MGLLEAMPIIGPALDAGLGIISSANQRSAFKHRYQDTVKDMKAAGLNPALAYGQGGGNPTTVPLPAVGDTMVKGVTGAAQAAQLRATTDKTMAETGYLKAATNDMLNKLKLENTLLGADIGLRGAQTGTTVEQGFLARAQAGLAGAHTNQAEANVRLMGAQQALAEAQTGVAQNEAYYKRTLGDLNDQEFRRLAQTFDSDVRARIARNAADMFAPANSAAGLRGVELNNQIMNLTVPQLQAMAAYYSGAGKYEPYADALARYADKLIPWKRNADANRPEPPRREVGFHAK